MLRKTRVLLSSPLVLVLSVWAVSPLQRQPSTEFLQCPHVSGNPGGNLVLSVNSEPASFSRLFSTGIDHTMITDRLNADLVHINRVTFELEPALASSWERAPDGRSYTVKLRRGLQFSDGSPFTADDVLFTFQVIQDPKSMVRLADQVKVDGAFPAITRLDDHTVRFTYQRPIGLGLRSLDSVPMIPKRIYEKPYREGSLASVSGPATQASGIVGMGPFRLREYQRGVKVVLEKNPFYWKTDKSGRRLPFLDTITFLVIPDRNSEALRFQAGELDAVNLLNAENYALLRRSQSNGRFTVRDLGPGISFDYLWFNLNPGSGPSGKPWVDPEKRAVFEQASFRRGISLALNREGIGSSVFLGLGTPGSGPVSPGNRVWYDPKLPKPAYDPARAAELLVQSGLKDTDGDGVVEFGASRRPLEITVHTARGNMAREKTAQIIKDDLDRLGVRINLQFSLPNELGQRLMAAHDYEAMIFGFTTTDIAPDSQTDLWYSRGAFHFWHPNQPKPLRPWEARTDELMSRLVRTLDPGARITIFAEIQQIWAREMPAIPLVVPNILSGWASRVGNVRPSVLVPHVIWNAEELAIRPRAIPSS